MNHPLRVTCRKCGEMFGSPRGYTECPDCRIDIYHQMKDSLPMTPDELYELGYHDAKAGKAMNASYMTDPNYKMGFEDGSGDVALTSPTNSEYSQLNDPPEEFEFVGEKRVPRPYEFYLSKGGKATAMARARKNSQTRHILACSTCHTTDAHACVHHTIKVRT
jgi:hypothetical protein